MLPRRRSFLLGSAVLSAALLTCTFLLWTAVQRYPLFTLNVYLPFSRAVSGILGWLFSFSAYAVAEALVALIAATAVFLTIRSAVRSVRERSAVPLLLWLSGAVLCAVSVLFLFMLLWGGTYHSPKLETRLGLDPGPQEEVLLFLTADRHLDDVIKYAGMMTRTPSGAVDAGGFETLAPEAARASKALAERIPELMGRAVITPPKRMAAAPLFGYLGISGIYSPLTGESIVNTTNTDPFLPSVMTHELAHRLGFAPEEDANFIAYLTCMESSDPVFRYSGSLMAFNYCYNALSREYRSVLWTRLAEESEETLRDFARNREAWARYDGPVREKAQAVNNAYLQSMGQPEGIRSYGRVADLLIALYLSESGSML
jgi:hypothetical protein